MAENVAVEIAIEASRDTGAISTAATEVEGFQQAVDKAAESAKKGSDNLGLMDEATKELESSLAKLGTAAAIGAFFKDAIEESLKEAEALRQLQFAIEATGASWAAYSEEIERFARIQQATTRFDDTITFEVLGRIARVTGDVGQAMRGTALAQDIASASGNNLAQTSELVSQLLAGNERAVIQARKEYGAFVGDATNAQQALDGLVKGFSGAAQAEESATKSLAQTKNFLADFSQSVGDGLVPVLEVAARSLAFLVKGFQELGIVVGAAGAALFEVAAGQFEMLRQIASGNFSGVVDAAAQMKTGLVTIAEETGREIEKIEESFNGSKADKAIENGKLIARQSAKDAEETAQKRREIEEKLSQQFVEDTESRFQAQREALEREIAAAEEAGIQKFEVKVAGVEQEVTLEEFKAERLRQIAAAETDSIRTEERKRLDEKKRAEAETKKLEDTRKQNFASTLQFISTLSSAKNAELRAIGKAAALAMAYINTSEAVTKALASAPPPFNFVLAAAVGAAGAAQVANIAGTQLEQGGLVEGTPEGLRATIGERGKREAVIPLTNDRALRDIGESIAKAGGAGSPAGSAGTIINAYLVLPGIEAIRDPSVARAILEVLAENLAAETPEARTFAVRTMDLAEMNNRRSA